MGLKFPGWLVALSYAAAFAAGGWLGWWLTSRVADEDVEALARENTQLTEQIAATAPLLAAKQDSIEALAAEADSLRNLPEQIRTIRVETKRKQRESWMSLAEYLSAQADTAALALLDEHLRLDDRVTEEYEGEISALRQLAENQATQIRLLTEVGDTLRAQRDSLLTINAALVAQNRQLVRKLNPPLFARIASYGVKCGLTGTVAGLGGKDAKLGALTGGVCVLVEEFGGKLNPLGLLPGL